MSDADLRRLSDPSELEEAMRLESAVLYTHSPTSWRGFSTLAQLRRLALARPGLPVLLIDADETADLAREAARRLGIAHEAPKLLFLEEGSVAWETTRSFVRFRTLQETAERVFDAEVGTS